MKVNRTRPTRIIHARTVTNGELVDMVTAAAKVAARSMRWPHQLSRHDAPQLVHAYLKSRVRYFAEPPSMQVVRLPSATVKQKVADCKSTAVFLAGALAAAGHRVTLRFIKQRGGATYSHVYVLANGVPVDPLLAFGRESLSSARKDVPIS